MNSAHETGKLVGEYGLAASKPIIFMVLMSRSAALWLRSLFIEMSESDESVDLCRQEGVDLRNIESLELCRVDHDGRRTLAKDRKRTAFIWSCSREEWEWNACLIDPFVNGRAGHQYLTSHVADDAEIEISYGEGNVFDR